MDTTSVSDADLERTFGGLFVGFMLSATLYGLTLFQTYLYFTRYRNDPQWQQYLIGIFWALDTVTTGLLSHALYNYLIIDFRIKFTVINMTMTLCVQHALTTLTVALVHFAYAYRVWSVTKKNRYWTGSIVISTVASFVTGIVAIVQLFEDKRFIALERTASRITIGFNIGLSTLSSVLITAALIRYLSPKRLDVTLPTSKFERTIIYVINRGSLNAFTQLLYYLTFIISPRKLIWIPFPLFIAKVYVNVYLVMLNYRPASSGRGYFEEEKRTTITPTSASLSGFKAGTRRGQLAFAGKSTHIGEVDALAHGPRKTTLRFELGPKRSQLSSSGAMESVGVYDVDPAQSGLFNEDESLKEQKMSFKD